jgi:hypothetical protein
MICKRRESELMDATMGSARITLDFCRNRLLRPSRDRIDSGVGKYWQDNLRPALACSFGKNDFPSTGSESPIASRCRSQNPLCLRHIPTSAWRSEPSWMIVAAIATC